MVLEHMRKSVQLGTGGSAAVSAVAICSAEVLFTGARSGGGDGGLGMLSMAGGGRVIMVVSGLTMIAERSRCGGLGPAAEAPSAKNSLLSSAVRSMSSTGIRGSE